MVTTVRMWRIDYITLCKGFNGKLGKANNIDVRLDNNNKRKEKGFVMDGPYSALSPGSILAQGPALVLGSPCQPPPPAQGTSENGGNVRGSYLFGQAYVADSNFRAGLLQSSTCSATLEKVHANTAAGGGKGGARRPRGAGNGSRDGETSMFQRQPRRFQKNMSRRPGRADTCYGTDCVTNWPHGRVSGLPAPLGSDWFPGEQ